MKFISLFNIALMNIKSNVASTVLSFLWFPLGFFILIITKIIIFNRAFADAQYEYGMYLAIGLWFWFFWNRLIQRALFLYQNNITVLNINFYPHSLLKILFIENLIIYFCNFIVIGSLIVFYDYLSFYHLLLFFMAVFLTCLFIYFAVFLVSIFVFFSVDLSKLISSVMIVLFFATPIIWDPIILNNQLQWIVVFNPLHHFLVILREPILIGHMSIFSLTICMVCTAFLAGIYFIFCKPYINFHAARI